MSAGDVPLVPEVTEALPRVQAPEGLLSWLASVDHKQIGIMYLLATFAFFLIGGLEALLLRFQLAAPNNTVMSPQAYNQVFTMHGTTMIFLVIMPMLIGFATYLVPLMAGANDIAFPRLNALSFWLFFFGGLLLYASFLGGGAPDVGWFAYAPLTEFNFSANAAMNYWGMGVLTMGIGTIGAAINLMVTILTMRAPGLTLRRLPLFVWMTLLNSVLILFALPSLNASVVMLMFDRLLHGHFFDPAGGGQPLLWQHAFWSFGHPEVYIMILPAWGMISEIIPVFSRRPIFGYEFVAAATAGILILSMLVWGHHMFTSGMGNTLDLAFGAASMLIAIPTGIKVFNWTATTWGGTLIFKTAMLFALAFVVQFTIGGVTGVMFAAFPVDWQMEDSYFVVAHLHYVLMGGTAFAMWAGIYYWFPKVTGRLLSERLGKLNFWLAVIGFNLAFMVQHLLGFLGMPRRIYAYSDYPWWHLLNLLSSIGAAILGLSVLVFVWNVIASLRRGEPAGDNPWDAWTLEWATSSPPALHSFEQVPPVRSRRPLWDLAHPEKPDWKKNEVPGFLGSWVPGFPRPPAPPRNRASAEEPSVSGGTQEPPARDKHRLGMLLFIASEGVFFALLILAFVFYRNSPANAGGPTPFNSLDVSKMAIFTVCLWSSSLTIWLAGRSHRRGQTLLWRGWLLLTILLGAAFLYGESAEYLDMASLRGVAPNSDVFTSTFFALTGFHGFHVFIGLALLTLFFGLALAGHFKGGTRRAAVECISIYWHFVDGVWVVIFPTVYLGSLFWH